MTKMASTRPGATSRGECNEQGTWRWDGWTRLANVTGASAVRGYMRKPGSVQGIVGGKSTWGGMIGRSATTRAVYSRMMTVSLQNTRTSESMKEVRTSHGLV